MPWREQLASMSELSLPKGEGTEPSVQSTRSQRRRESRWVRAAPWRERKGGGSEREHEEERVGSMMKKGRFRGKSGQARGASLGEVEECMSG